MEGALSKWTNVMKGWQYRWFVLDDASGLFSYYTSKEKMRKGVRRGCVRLRGAIVGIDDEDDSTFTITVDNKTFHFQAKDSVERENWIRALEDTIMRHNAMSRRQFTSRHVLSSGGPVKMEDFDKKLTETDCYLQMLIDQNTELQSKVEAGGEEVYAPLVDKVNDMVESVKHAIVLLQIAKNACGADNDVAEDTLAPVHGVNVNLTVDKGVEEATEGGASSSSSARPSPRPSPATARSPATLSPGSAHLRLSNQLPVTSSSSTSERKSSTANKNSSIPAVSYSSSDDDEDDFFDAQEGDAGSRAGSDIIVNNHQELMIPAVQQQDPVTPLTPSDVDWDALYENDGVEEDVDMKSHGSVITHLLSQVRIGMDLTKIVLPTFILERRSLLEMYADFFAHPDLFSDIAVMKTPELRMVQVLKWYLSSFSASRKSTIAKKPYNPILGEIFRCWYKVPDVCPPESVTQSPIPWCSSTDLVFLAEQVSHHPPVSAFYAECEARNISFTGHIYTKSAFLGMSIAVHNIGEGKVSLLDHGEDYILTFPSAYGRSILTTPWVELGGTTKITCPQTGFSANIDFIVKPFFGTDYNKVKAEVFAPGAKKPVLKVEGEWNGRMTSKTGDGRTETFLDVTRMPIFPKSVKRVNEQEKHESRRLWREVTHGLKHNHIDAATEAKCALEQKQRDDAKERKEKNIKWEHRMFLPIGENWHFKNSLGNRK